MDLTHYMQTARRVTVGRSVLGWAALACLALNGAFWYSLFIGILSPPALLSPQTVQAALMVVAYAIILPLFWSMLAPSSPAGRLLQRTQWATPGYMLTVAAALFLTYHAGRIVYAWWLVQPAVAEAREALFLAITSLIAGVLVPALCWTVVTPEQWLAQIEQARNVRQIEHAMRMEEAAMRAAYARAVTLLSAELTNLTIQQRRELAGILGGFARMQQQSMRSLASSWKAMYGVEAQLAAVPDEELLAGYKQVAHLLTDGAGRMDEAVHYLEEVEPGATLRQDAAHTHPTERPVNVHPNDRTTERATVDLPHQERNRTFTRTTERPNDRTTSGPLADHRTTERPNAQAFDAACSALDGAWTRADLESALSISKTQAHDYLKAWQAAGLVVNLTEPRHHYQFVQEK